MPFDGNKLCRPVGPRPSTQVPAGRWAAWTVRLRALLPGRGPGAHGAWSWPPRRPGGAEVTAVHLLRAARALVEAEGAWGRGAYEAPDGRRCAVGALCAAAARADWRASPAGRKAHGFLLAVARERGFETVETMNDGSGHAEVLAAFDDAVRGATPRRPTHGPAVRGKPRPGG